MTYARSRRTTGASRRARRILGALPQLCVLALVLDMRLWTMSEINAAEMIFPRPVSMRPEWIEPSFTNA